MARTVIRPSSTPLTVAADHAAPGADLEAYQALVDLCRKKTGAIPDGVLCRHVLRVTSGADWPVQRAALEALLRRLDAAKREKLSLAARPPRGRVLGTYKTRRPGHGARPYVTRLESLSPPAGRCSCPDFAKSSLGLCKHLLVLLMDIFPKAKLVDAAAREREASTAPRLRFDALRPLTGAGDWLKQVLWEPRGAESAADPLSRWFGSGPGVRRLRATFSTDAKQRLALVNALLAAAADEKDGDPALPALLSEERDRLDRVLRDAPLRKGLDRLLSTLRCPLYPYQIEGIERFLAAGRLLLADDMGLGKTAQAIGACHALWQAGRVKKGLLIVPASLKPQWQREWHHFSDAKLILVEGGPEERARIYEAAQHNQAGFLLLNYELLLRDLPRLHAFSPDLVVLDEAQRIKNWATKTALCTKTLQAPYRLVLTGTPMENRLDELASIMEWVDAGALEPKWRLQPFHSYTGDGGTGGARNLETLRERLAPSMLRRIRKEVLRQLPPRTDTRVPVEMTPQQRSEHDELNQPIASLIARAHKRPLTPAEHLKLMSLLTTQRVISNGLGQLHFTEVWPTLREAQAPTPALREGLFAPKLEVLRDLITQLVLEQGRKVVIFSQWRRMLKLADWVLSDLLRQAGLRSVFFTGAESGKRRTQNIVDFHDDAQTRVMMLTDAGGVGLNLQRAASACINLEMPWNPAVLEQRIGRIYRMGQKSPIDVYNLITEQGIEARIADLVGNKRALFTGLFDGTSDEVRYEHAGSLLSRIERFYPVEEAVSQGEDLADGEALEADTEALAPVLELADEPLVDVAQPEEERIAEHVMPAAAVAEDGNGHFHAPIPSQTQTDLVRQLFANVRFERTDRGGLRIEASAEAASTLAALFQGMAGLMEQASAP